MDTIERKIGNINITYIGGGSRNWARGFMRDLANDSSMSGTVRLYDIDKEAAAINAIIGNKISEHPHAKSKWHYEVSDTLGSALDDAHIVIISILPGTFKEMYSDVHAPEKYGIYQAVGDTTGPAGLIRAMRTIPVFAEIAQAVKEHSPNAWVLNYTNPMAISLSTMYEVYPEIQAFGCCHEVFSTQKLLAAMLEDEMGITGITRQEIKTNVLGINHFTWIDSASWQGTDLFPLYSKFVEKHFETGFTLGDENWLNSHFHSANRVKMDLFKRFGLMAAAGDRHLAEFLPNSWYLDSPEMVAKWKFSLTTVDWRIKNEKALRATSQAQAAGNKDIDLKSSGEEGHLLIKALLGLEDMISNVNLPNKGQVSNLPIGTIVETNALFRGNELRPILAGSLPKNILDITSRHVANQKNILQAGLDCDYDLALKAFLNDPLLDNLAQSDGEKLFKNMLNATKSFLPKKWNDK